MYNKISGYTLTFNCISQLFPWKESITSHLSFCDEVIVIDDNSTDGTLEELLLWAKTEPKLIVEKANKPDDKHLNVYSGSFLKTKGRQLCSGEFLWQFDVDEIVHENDYQKIHNLCEQIPKESKLVILPVIEFWGSKGKVRIDVNPWKWRLSRNDPKIIHGIPGNQRCFDENGKMFSKGSDGDDYIFSDTLVQVPLTMTYSNSIELIRRKSLSDPHNQNLADSYGKMLKNYINAYPGVYHYSWWSLSRKIYAYKTYWHKHWANFFNQDTTDTSENNVFFDKPWSEVNDQDIKEMSEKLESDMGGWIFHNKIDFSKTTPSFKFTSSHPKIINQWATSNH